jgi:hypothetical protein
VLLNLMSNGFYAATRRKAEANGGGYEPTLAAATKNLGDSVEVRIRDNGAGIPPEVKDKTVLHDEARRRGHRAWLIHQPRHHRQATWRVYRGRYPARRVYRVPDCSAARGCDHRQIRREPVNLLTCGAAGSGQ